MQQKWQLEGERKLEKLRVEIERGRKKYSGMINAKMAVGKKNGP